MFEMFNTQSLPQNSDIGDNGFPSLEEDLFSSVAELDIAEENLRSLNVMSSTIDELEHLGSVVQEHGVTRSLLAFTNKNQLLSSVLPSINACESLGYDANADSQEAISVCDEIRDSVENMIGDFFSRAWETIVSVGDSILHFCGWIGRKISDAVSWVANKVWSAAEAAAEFVEAHPVATVLGVLGVAVGIPTLLSSLWKIPLPSETADIAPWVDKMCAKISSSLGDIGRSIMSITPEGIRFSKSPVKVKASAGALGYTKDVYSKLSSSAKSLFSKGGLLERSVVFVKNKSKDILSSLTKETEQNPWATPHIPRSVSSVPHVTRSHSAERTALHWLTNTTNSLWRFCTKTAGECATSSMSIFKRLADAATKSTPQPQNINTYNSAARAPAKATERDRRVSRDWNWVTKRGY